MTKGRRPALRQREANLGKLSFSRSRWRAFQSPSFAHCRRTGAKSQHTTLRRATRVQCVLSRVPRAVHRAPNPGPPIAVHSGSGLSRRMAARIMSALGSGSPTQPSDSTPLTMRSNTRSQRTSSIAAARAAGDSSTPTLVSIDADEDCGDGVNSFIAGSSPPSASIICAVGIPRLSAAHDAKR